MQNQDPIHLTHLVNGYGGVDIRTAALRNYHILHYVVEGDGYIEIEGRKFYVATGQTFYFPPETRICYYSAKGNASWKYYWVNFVGKQAEELLKQTAFSKETPVCSSTDSPLPLFKALRECEHNAAGVCLANGLLMQLIAFYINAFPNENILRTEYSTRPILAFIRNNLYRPELTVDLIARTIGISRVTLYRRFMEEAGVSPTDYIKSRRLIRASQMLTSTDLPVSQIAYSVGYNDPLYFSKIYKSFFGKSPTEYRKNN
ncbi:MAG: helix-turn-helix domain-containing protein [Clostridia bacterium]|nr:helix-turn-helix domain-containing protein [Clostridia bacterium]